jgi:hypothetical protein
MTSPSSEDWRQASHRALTEAIAGVRALLDKRAPGPETAEPGGALGFLTSAFGLSPFERWLLILCAAVELDGELAGRCAGVMAEVARRPYATFALALGLFPDGHWDALTPDRPLRRFRLIELVGDEALLVTRLKVDERVLHFLTGVPAQDERLRGIAELMDLSANAELAPSQRAVADRVTMVWTRAERPLPVVMLCGGEHHAKEQVVAAACKAQGRALTVIRAADVPQNASDRDGLARLWEREAVLGNSALLLEGDDSDHPEHQRAATALAERLSGLVAVASPNPWRFTRRLSVRFDVERPPPAEQESLWRGVLGAVSEGMNGQLGNVVAQFSLSAAGMRAAGAEVTQRLREEEGGVGQFLWDACRHQARPRMDDLAQRITPAAGWYEIVLPDEQLRLLRDVAAHVRQRAKVYEHWGFARQGSRGLGITALFAGSSGTGKTMAAEVIARDLSLDLYRVDLSQVVSKYIGETEKNLRRIFDAAEEGGAVLLFDEADALFGKRSDVKDSHDRYANLEVSYLLQRMEAYRGLAILTTNMRTALDTAFLRRLRFIIEFPFPGNVERAEIWRRIFPRETPTEGLDVQRLARLNVPGGVIRNIALNAAFLAADRDEPVRMTHLRHAAEIEFVKLERPFTEAELGGWS